MFEVCDSMNLGLGFLVWGVGQPAKGLGGLVVKS